MNTPSSRLKVILDHFNLSNLAFATRLGVSSTVINGIVKGEHKPGPKVLDAIKREYPQISTDWILSGSGSMLVETSPTLGQEILTRFGQELAQLREVFANQLSAKDQQIASLQRMLEATLGKSNDVTPDRSSLRTHPATERLMACELVG